MKLSDYIFQRLDQWGVRHVFLLPGGGAMHLNDALGRCGSPGFVACLHEQAAAIAAEAYARVTNNLGVALVTTGPGGTNAITGLAAAWLDSTPCLFLSGQVKRADLKGDLGLRQMGVQEIDIVAVAGPLTKYAQTVMDPGSIRYHLEKAVYLAKSGRPGPVWLDIPLDVQAAEIDPDRLPGFEPPVLEAPAGNLDDEIDEVLTCLARAERPVLMGGNGIRLAGATGEFLELAERLGIPVLTTWLGMDLIADDHPLFMGRPGAIAPRGANFTLQNSDFMLAVGSRLDMAMVGYAYDRLARSAVKVVVDIDPGELRKFKDGVQLPICADAGAFLRGMLARVRDGAFGKEPWLQRCRDWKVRYPVVLPEHRERTVFVSTYAFSEALSGALPPGALVASMSAGACVEMFLLAFKVKRNQRIFHNRGTGSMGFAVPAALAACLASGGKPTICVEADGGFQMNTQELETIRRLGLPIKIFVLNNQGYASIRASQSRHFGKLTGADATSGLTLPDTLGLASAYGIPATRIRSGVELASGLEKVLAMPGPFLCEVMMPPDEDRAPCLSSRQLANGSMVSPPLEDLWPFLDRAEFRSNMIIEPLADA